MDKKAKARLPSGSKLRWEREGAENTLRGEREQKTDKSSDSTVSKKAQRKQIQKEAASKKKKESAKTRQEAESAAKRKGKLKFETADGKKPDKPGRKVIHAPADMASVKVHQLVHASNEDNNTGVQSAEFAEGAGETSLHVASNAKYSHKLHKYKKAERLEKKADKTQIEELFQKSLKENPEAASNVFSRWRQKQEIKKEYSAMKAGKSEAQAAYRTGSTVISRVKKEFEDFTAKAFQFVTEHSHIIILILGAALLLLVISGMLSSCTTMLGGSGNAVIGTSYTAEDDDILGAEADYRAMEEELRLSLIHI